MPNHCSTITIFSCYSPEVLKELKALIWRTEPEREEPFFDFNSVIPFPDLLKNSVSPVLICTEEDKVEKYKDNNQYITQIELDRRINECGATSWYDWNCKNWGTKWNSYDCSIDESNKNSLILKYDTAWSPATPVLQEISKRFPLVNIVSEYADEGGSFVCRDTFANNSAEFGSFNWNSEEGIEIRRKVGYYYEDEEPDSSED